MLTKREIEEIKNKRRRLRNDSTNYNTDPHDLAEGEQKPLKRKDAEEEQQGFEKAGGKANYGGKDDPGKWMDQEFYEEYVKMNDPDSNVNDPWLQSLKTSEYDDTQVVYEVKNKPKKQKDDKMDLLYKMPKVEVIRKLVAKLDDGQSPADYLKSRNYKEKREADAKSGEYQVSDLAHVLTMSWQNVYYMTREDIVEALMCYRNNDKELKNYEFRWEKDDLAVHGPYPHEDILMWVVYGYVSEENPILVRELDANGVPYTQEWTHYKDSDVYNIFPPSTGSKKESEGKKSLKSGDNQKKEYEGEEGPGREESPEKQDGQGDEDGNDEEDDEEDYQEEEGFGGRKRSKFIGMNPKTNPSALEKEVEEDDDDEQVD